MLHRAEAWIRGGGRRRSAGVSASGAGCDVGATTTSGTVTLDDFALVAN